MKSNRLVHKILTTDVEGNPLEIKISLDDDCKNGHIDFSITGTGWQKGKPRNDRSMIYGGCCHEAILKARADLKLFVDLHLSDCKGFPMYALENGIYHIKQDPSGKTAKDYLRITDEEFELLKTATESKIFFAIILEKLGIIKRWNNEAQAAIKKLEELTESEFEDTSTRYQFEMPSVEEIEKIGKQVEEGFFTPEKVEIRKKENLEIIKSKKFDDLLNKKLDKIAKIELEYKINCAVLKCNLGVDENFIYYNHSNKVVFNWIDYKEKITQDQFDEFLKVVDLSQFPEGVTFELKK
jgi:hypothetical protein